MRTATLYVYSKVLREDPRKLLYIGFSLAGKPLEVISVLNDDGTEVVIHAMQLRKTYHPLIDWRRTMENQDIGGFSEEQIAAMVAEAESGYDPKSLGGAEPGGLGGC